MGRNLDAQKGQHVQTCPGQGLYAAHLWEAQVAWVIAALQAIMPCFMLDW